MDERQSLVNDCGNGLVALFYNEEKVNVVEHAQTGNDAYEDKEISKYGYDYLELQGVDASNLIESVVEATKSYVVGLINAYDTSDKVNSFTIGGKGLWLDRNTRAALMRRFEAEKASGVETTTLWYGEGKFEMPVDTAIGMLNSIEIYACKCYDVTAAHKAAVGELTDIEEILNYDFASGYPDKLEFDA